MQKNKKSQIYYLVINNIPVLFLVSGFCAFLFFIGNKYFVSEILVFLSIALLTARIYLKVKYEENTKNFYLITLVSLVLILLFILLHLFFCYQLGFPASTNQEPQDLNLTSSDWLGFVGNYLGFAGSLVMAFLVFRQSRIIDDFTISEYKPSILMENVDCKKSTDIAQFNKDSILQKDTENNRYYMFFPSLMQGRITDNESFDIVIYVVIKNYSKSTLHNFSFKSLEIKQLDNDKQSLLYENKNTDDSINIKTHLFPKKSVRRCFLMREVPKEINISMMTITFGYGSNSEESLEARMIVSKEKGEAMRFINLQ